MLRISRFLTLTDFCFSESTTTTSTTTAAPSEFLLMLLFAEHYCTAVKRRATDYIGRE
jgi:hypothetical protein